MAVEIGKLIAAINPDIFCAPEKRAEVKKLVKEKGYLVAAEKAKPYDSPFLYKWDEAKKNPLENWGLKAPIEKHEIDYDSTTESIEPLYFWLLDFLEKRGNKIDKLVDNFVSSPGSGHFSELGQKATRMQEEAMKMLGAVNQVIKSILNLIYDLKEFKLRLGSYDDLHSKDEVKRRAALLSLKQIWIDNVDFVKRGNSSIKAMAQQFDFVTLLDAFMAAGSAAEASKLDLNLRVKRILEQRVGEFFNWIEQSERELRKRYEIEKRYLQSQISTVKLYARWIKPYLKAAKKLEQSEPGEDRAAGLVTAFNTIMFELKLFAKKDFDPADQVRDGTLPKVFEKVKARKYSSVVVVEFYFRGLPYRVSQRGDWSFGGRTQIKFTSYALNDQEIKVLKKEIEKDDFQDVMKLIQGATSETLDQLQSDVDEFLEEDKEKKEKKKEEEYEDTNPFSALLSLFKFKPKEPEEEDLSKGIKPDNLYEQVIRSQAIIEARDECFNTFDIYKRAHSMPAHVNPFDSVD